jgi:hypothetical protein
MIERPVFVVALVLIIGSGVLRIWPVEASSAVASAPAVPELTPATGETDPVFSEQGLFQPSAAAVAASREPAAQAPQRVRDPLPVLGGLAEDGEGFVAWLGRPEAPAVPVRLGDAHGQWQIDAIDETSVTLSRTDEVVVLRLFGD